MFFFPHIDHTNNGKESEAEDAMDEDDYKESSEEDEGSEDDSNSNNQEVQLPEVVPSISPNGAPLPEVTPTPTENAQPAPMQGGEGCTAALGDVVVAGDTVKQQEGQPPIEPHPTKQPASKQNLGQPMGHLASITGITSLIVDIFM